MCNFLSKFDEIICFYIFDNCLYSCVYMLIELCIFCGMCFLRD